MKGLRYLKKFIGMTVIVVGVISLVYVTFWTTGHDLWELFKVAQVNAEINVWTELFSIAGRFVLSFILAGVLECIGIFLLKD